MSSLRFAGTGAMTHGSRWTVPIYRFVTPARQTRHSNHDSEDTPGSSSVFVSRLPSFNKSTTGSKRCFGTTRPVLGRLHSQPSSLDTFRRFLHTSSPCLAPDPYGVLGLSRDASAQDIKKRYRELAKQYHPDLNPGPEASSKMASISSAYQVLSDPKQKQFFDQTGMSAEEAGVNPDQASNPFHGAGVDPSFMFTDFTNFFHDAFGGRSGGHVHKGEDIATEVTLEFLEAAKGCRRAVHLQANTSCGDCSGTGCSPGTSMSTCRACSGTGTQKIERGPIIFGTVCSRCNGSGQIVAHPCKACKGSGTRAQPKAVDLDFPAGIRSGMELRISGQGHAGARGGRAGDLFVKVNVRPDSIFKLIQNDIHVTVPLTLRQCLLGGEIFVPTLEGKLKLTVAPGTSPGEVKMLRGKGIKKIQERGYGDIAVHWELDMPRILTNRQKELILEFDEIQFGTSTESKRRDVQDSSNIKQTNCGSSRTVPPPPRPSTRNSRPVNGDIERQNSERKINSSDEAGAKKVNGSDEAGVRSEEKVKDEAGVQTGEPRAKIIHDSQSSSDEPKKDTSEKSENGVNEKHKFSASSWFNKKFGKMEN